VNGGKTPIFVTVSGEEAQEPRRVAAGETVDLELSAGDTWTAEDDTGKVLESQTIPGRVLQCVSIAATTTGAAATVQPTRTSKPTATATSRPKPTTTATNNPKPTATAIATATGGGSGSSSGNNALCADIPAPTNADVMVRFVNNSGIPAYLTWINPDGELVEYAPIEPGVAFDQETFVGHQWAMYDANPQEVDEPFTHLMLSYTATEETTQCVILESATGTESGSSGSGSAGATGEGTTAATASGGKVAIVTAASLNVRGGPGATYQVVGRVTQGQELTVVDENAASGWVQVEIPNGTGWVSGDFVRIETGTGSTGDAGTATSGSTGGNTGGTTSGTTSGSGTGPLSFDSFGNWQRGDQPYGAFTANVSGGQDGGSAGELKYDFTGSTAANDFVVFTQRVAIAGQPNVLRANVKGDASGHLFNLWIEDANGEVWSVPMGAVSHTGWQQMTGIIDPNAPWPGGRVYGPENGVIDYPIRFLGLVIDRTDGPTTGTILFDNIVPVSDPSATLAQPEAAPDTDTATAVPDLCADILAPEAGYELTVRFANAAQAPVVIFWVNFENQRVEVARLRPGEFHDENSFVAHRWVIQDESGNVLGEYTNSAAQMQCVQIS